MRAIALLLLVPFVAQASAHGALEINEFDTYAISDFEGHEESFAWEGWEIWDVYAGDGALLDGHGVYFKVNVAGDGTLRPTGGQVWDLSFSYTVGNESYVRTIAHDGNEVTTDFDQLDWQVADGNVFQVHAWAAVPAWQNMSIADLVVVSSVDGSPRDSAPGGIHDPATGEEVPVSAPASGVFPPMGEGRLVETVALTGSAKWLDVNVSATGTGATFDVTNPLAAQGQHFMVVVGDGWNVTGVPAAASLDGGSSTSFTLALTPPEGVVEPLRIDLLTDIGGKQSYFAIMTDDGMRIVQEPAPAYTPAPTADTPGFPLVLALLALVLARRR